MAARNNIQNKFKLIVVGYTIYWEYLAGRKFGEFGESSAIRQTKTI